MKKIAIIEDLKSVNDVLREVIQLEFDGVEVLQFYDIPEDINELTEADILILDCNLPSGFICDSDCFKKCDKPKILITGDITFKCNLNNCVMLYKPFTAKDIISIINNIMNGDIRKAKGVLHA